MSEKILHFISCHVSFDHYHFWFNIFYDYFQCYVILCNFNLHIFYLFHTCLYAFLLFYEFSIEQKNPKNIWFSNFEHTLHKHIYQSSIHTTHRRQPPPLPPHNHRQHDHFTQHNATQINIINNELNLKMRI